MNPGTATFGSEGIVKPKELFFVTMCVCVSEGVYNERITKGMLDKREP